MKMFKGYNTTIIISLYNFTFFDFQEKWNGNGNEPTKKVNKCAHTMKNKKKRNLKNFY